MVDLPDRKHQPHPPMLHVTQPCVLLHSNILIYTYYTSHQFFSTQHFLSDRIITFIWWHPLPLFIVFLCNYISLLSSIISLYVYHPLLSFQVIVLRDFPSFVALFPSPLPLLPLLPLYLCQWLLGETRAEILAVTLSANRMAPDVNFTRIAENLEGYTGSDIKEVRLITALACCDVLWCTVVWCGVVWCTVVCCDVVWCDVIWCDVMWSDVMCRIDVDEKNHFYNTITIILHSPDHTIPVTALPCFALHCRCAEKLSSVWLTNELMP